MTSSTATSEATIFADARANLYVDRRRCHHLLALLHAEAHGVVAGVVEGVLGAVASEDGALARLVWLTVFGALRRQVVTPCPLDRRTVEILGIVGTAFDFDDKTHFERGEADRWRGLE